MSICKIGWRINRFVIDDEMKFIEDSNPFLHILLIEYENLPGRMAVFPGDFVTSLNFY